jgi:GDP-mannose 6-dehydrogenase
MVAVPAEDRRAALPRESARRRDPDAVGGEASNEVHLEHGISAVLETGKRSVAMIGLSFKSGTDDLRESPLVVMAERFIGKGLKLGIYDPGVNLSRLLGANRRHIEESIPHIGSLMSDDLARLIDEAQVLVVGLRSDRVVGELRRRCRPDHFVLTRSSCRARCAAGQISRRVLVAFRASGLADPGEARP